MAQNLDLIPNPEQKPSNSAQNSKSKPLQGFILCIFISLLGGLGLWILLPSLSNQANKSRQSEALQYIGSMNRAQQALVIDPNYAPPEVLAEVLPTEQYNTEQYNTEQYNTEQYNTEDYNLIVDNPFHSPQHHPLSTFAIDVDTAAYSNLRRFLHRGSQPPPDAVRIEELVNYFTYDYPQPQGDHPFTITTEVAQAPWNPDHQLVHLGLQGKTVAPIDLPPSNLVFLLDVSGSMQDTNKLSLVTSAMGLLVDQMGPEDTVSIVVYAGAAGTVLPPTPGNRKRRIHQAIRRLNAGGSTAGGEGIKRAYQLAQTQFKPEGNNRVILATDGDFNVGTSSEAGLIRLIERYRDQDIFLTVLGVGMGNYQDGKLEQLANHGNGNYAYLDHLGEAEKVLVMEIQSTLFTIAKDVKVQVEFNPNQVQAYRLIGYENRLLQAEDFNDNTKDAGELGAGHSVTALYEIIPIGVDPQIPLGQVDDLKYQSPGVALPPRENPELLSVKLRYKAPNGIQSELMTHPVLVQDLALDSTSNNFRFAAAVAQFGMILRGSDYQGNASFAQVLALAQAAQGPDPYGYRAEFIELVQTSQSLKLASRTETSPVETSSIKHEAENNLHQLGLGIAPETANYRYSTQVTEEARFQYAIPKRDALFAVVGGVFGQDSSPESILCRAIIPAAKIPPEPVLVDGIPTCAPGTEEMR